MDNVAKCMPPESHTHVHYSTMISHHTSQDNKNTIEVFHNLTILNLQQHPVLLLVSLYKWVLSKLTCQREENGFIISKGEESVK